METSEHYGDHSQTDNTIDFECSYKQEQVGDTDTLHSLFKKRNKETEK